MSITSRFVPSIIPVEISFERAVTTLVSDGGSGGLLSASEKCGNSSRINCVSMEFDRKSAIAISRHSERAMIVAL
jgi:hypothetical protein